MCRHKLLLMLALAMLTVVAACGGGGGGGGGAAGGGGGGGTTTVETNLHPVFYRTLDNAPVVQITLKRQNGAVIASNNITFDTRIETTGNRIVGQWTTATTDGNGKASVALPAGTYPLYITEPTGTPTGALNDTLTVTADMAKTYQASQQQWNITSPKNMSGLAISIIQTDASGNINAGTELRPLDEEVLFTTQTITAVGGATSASFTTELFQGTYRALIVATPTSTLDTIATYISPVFTAAGAGATETQNHTLKVSGNIVKLTLKDGANPVANGLYQMRVFDRTTRIMLGSSMTTSGVATVATGDFTDVVSVITSPGSFPTSLYAIHGYTASASHAADLVMSTIDGKVNPTSGTLQVNDTNAVVQAKINSGTGDYFDKTIASMFALNSAPVSTTGTGVYQIKLFEGNYILSAKNVDTFPDSQKLPITVSTVPMTGQNINVSVGGVITGRVQDVAKNDIAGVVITVKDATTNDTLGTATTAANGSYTISVPYGTYNLFANGAVTRNLVVSAANQTVTQNLTRYTVQGRLVDSAGGGLAGTLTWGGGTLTADALGTYTINIMQGENWVWFTPPTNKPSIGFENAAVLVDANTIASN